MLPLAGDAKKQQVWPSLVSWHDPMEARALPFELAALTPLRTQAGGRARPVEDEQPLLDATGSLDEGDVMRFYRERAPLYYLGQEVEVADATGRPTRPAVRMALRYGTLLEAIHLRLRRMMGGADRISRCRECGQLHLQGREDKEVCSPQHANTYWRRNKRQAGRRSR